MQLVLFGRRGDATAESPSGLPKACRPNHVAKSNTHGRPLYPAQSPPGRLQPYCRPSCIAAAQHYRCRRAPPATQSASTAHRRTATRCRKSCWTSRLLLSILLKPCRTQHPAPFPAREGVSVCTPSVPGSDQGVDCAPTLMDEVTPPCELAG